MYRYFDGRDENVIVCQSLDDALSTVDAMTREIGSVFVIGGSSVYEEALKNERCKRIFLTRVSKDEDIYCDTFFPQIPSKYRPLSLEETKTLNIDIPTELIKDKEYSLQFSILEVNK
jgi:dihydrofolate reductase